MSHWSDNRGPDALHWSDDLRHYLQSGDVILSRTVSDVSPAAFEDSVRGLIGSRGPRYGTGEAAETGGGCRSHSRYVESAAGLVWTFIISGNGISGGVMSCSSPVRLVMDIDLADRPLVRI